MHMLQDLSVKVVHGSTATLHEPDTATPNNRVLEQVGHITRQLHDALAQIGVLPQLQTAAASLPDARSRLSYISKTCGDAANKVLNLVDLARAEQTRMVGAARDLCAARSQGADQARDAALMATIESAHKSTDEHLTEIMLAQDYHDLTGQVVTKVVALALALEDSLLKLLVQSAPSDRLPVADSALQGPVYNSAGRSDVVTSQSEVDDLLTTLGF